MKYDNLLDLKDYADAKKIMETVEGLSESAYTLAQTAYQIKETQPPIARNFLKTVIQEMDDCEKKVEETDGGEEHQSSSTTGLEQIGKKEPAPEGMTSDTDVKDQMGVPIGEMAPPMGMPPQGVPPPQQPPMQQPPQQQMQYTIQEATAIRGQFKSIHEAIKSLDKKITETQNSQVKSIEVGIGPKGTPSHGSFIRETTGNQETDLETRRLQISKLNDAINTGTI